MAITEDEEAELNKAVAQLRDELKWRRTADMVTIGFLCLCTALSTAAFFIFKG